MYVDCISDTARLHTESLVCDMFFSFARLANCPVLYTRSRDEPLLVPFSAQKVELWRPAVSQHLPYLGS